jgi:microcystin-dependent protein
MHLIDGAGNVNGQFVAENVAASRPPTEITADFMNAIQNEIANFITSAGMNLQKTSNTQLRDALIATFARRDSTLHYLGEIYNIVADQDTLETVPTEDLPEGTKILVTSFYGLHQAAMAEWINGAWAATAIPLTVFDLYATTYDHHGYYWFSGDWNLFDVAAMQVDDATDEAAGIVRLATWAEVIAGSLAAVAVRPRYMIDYMDRIFVGKLFDSSGIDSSPVWVPAAGQLILRADRPLLWQWVQASGNLTSEADWPNNNWGKYTTGDGITNFRAPDLRGEFLRAWDNGRGVDPGRDLGSVQKGSLLSVSTGSVVHVWGVSTSAATAGIIQQNVGMDPYTESDYPASFISGTSSTANQSLPGVGGNFGYSGVSRPRSLAYPKYIYAGHPA